MLQENIQRRENQVIREVFERAGDLRKTMIVGVDYAAKQHRVAICNGQGDLLGKPFSILNDRKGLAFLEARVVELCKKTAIELSNVVFGGETPSSWAMNFAYNLRQNGHVLVDLHAQDVKRQRENMTTDNDNLSALTIARCLINKMGGEQPYTGVYTELRFAVRFQAKLAKEITRIQNRIGSCADVCFPGLLDPGRSGIPAHSKACFWILENSSPAAVCRMRVEKLEKQLRKCGVVKVRETAIKLKQLADRTLPCSEEMQRANRWRLKCLIAQHSLLKEQEKQTSEEAACLLRQTPGALLTSVKGIGVKFAFQLVAELGDPDRIENVDSKVNYLGLTEKSGQTGGDDKPKKKRGRQKRCSHPGKKAILGISDSVARWGASEYREYHTRRELGGQNARYALARKILRFAVSVLNTPHVYEPPDIRSEPAGSSLRRIYFRTLTEQMREKWRAYPACTDAEEDMLQQWEDMVRTLYN